VTPRQIRAGRIAHELAPRLWDFAYPMHGRGMPWVRLVAFRLWCLLLRLRLRS